ncbi:hypothetical protein Q7P37_002898 [Cladosporium fusiforme]
MMFPSPYSSDHPGYDTYIRPDHGYTRLVLAEHIRHSQQRALMADRRQGYVMALHDEIQDRQGVEGEHRGRQHTHRQPHLAGQSAYVSNRDGQHTQLEDNRSRLRSRSRHGARTAYREPPKSRPRANRRDEAERERRGRSTTAVSRPTTIRPEDSISTVNVRPRTNRHRREPESTMTRQSTIYPEDSVSSASARPRPSRHYGEPDPRCRSRAPTTSRYEQADYPSNPTSEGPAYRIVTIREPVQSVVHPFTRDIPVYCINTTREPAQSVVHPFTRDNYRFSQNYTNHQTSAPKTISIKPPLFSPYNCSPQPVSQRSYSPFEKRIQQRHGAHPTSTASGRSHTTVF